jgi:glycosyltransferase involved in cell wall biosynthesis
MKKVSIYVENAWLTPSSYYRLTQYFQPSEARFHSVVPDCVYHWWHSLGKNGRCLFSIPLYVLYIFRTLFFLIEDNLSISNGTVILARAIVPRRLPSLHKYLILRLAKRNKIVWELDDNILASKRISHADFHFYSKHSDIIVVSTDILLSLIDKRFAHKVKILPTTDGDFLGYDTEEVLLQRQSLYNEEIRLVWAATAVGLEYIQSIIPSLDDAAKALKELTGKKLTLHVVCNKPLQAESSCLEIVNIHWSREIAKKEIISSHIGLMPLPDTDFTRGKGGFKLIQYMSTAMPVIASAVGFNNEIVTDGVGYLINPSNDQTTNSPNDQTTWKEAIIELSSDWDNYAKMAKNAKDRYNMDFSFNKNKEFWKQLFY